MTVTCKLGDIRTNDAIWKLIDKTPVEMVCTVIEPETVSSVYKPDSYYERNISCADHLADLMRHELDQLYRGNRIFEYDFCIRIPALNGYFRIARERVDVRKEPLFQPDLLLFYSDDSDNPDVLSRGELYQMATQFLIDNDIKNPDETACIIEVSEDPAPVLWCRLRDLEDILRRTVADVHRNYELFELEEMRAPISHFYQYAYDYCVQIPALDLYFWYGKEAEIKESPYLEHSIFVWVEDCLLAYAGEEQTYQGYCYDTIPEFVDYYCSGEPRFQHMQSDAQGDLECMIELPYRMCRKRTRPEYFDL